MKEIVVWDSDNISRVHTQDFCIYLCKIGGTWFSRVIINKDCGLKFILYLSLVNPSTLKTDQCLISPCSNTAQSNIKVLRKKEVINK